jgi:hypothetical protein
MLSFTGMVWHKHEMEGFVRIFRTFIPPHYGKNKTGFYQLVLVNAVIYRNGLVKARNGSVYKHFSDFYHLTMVNARIYRYNLGFTNLGAFTVTYMCIIHTQQDANNNGNKDGFIGRMIWCHRWLETYSTNDREGSSFGRVQSGQRFRI